MEAQQPLLRAITNSKKQRQFRYVYRIAPNHNFCDSGDIFDGKWARAAMDGRGRLSTTAGNIFSGGWSQALANDSKFVSKWKVFVESRAEEVTSMSSSPVPRRRKDTKAEVKAKSKAEKEEPKRKFPTTSVYQGPYVDNLPHGDRAKFTYPGLGLYVGGFAQGQCDASITSSNSATKTIPRITWLNHARYRGSMTNGLPNGRGGYHLLKRDAEGDAEPEGGKSEEFAYKYSGSVKAGLKHGTGRLNLSSGHTYIGDFVDDRPHGLGEQHLPDGSAYRGEFKQGLRHGKGTFESEDMIFEGMWKHDVKSGKGRMITYIARQFRPSKKKDLSSMTISSARRQMWQSGSHSRLSTIKDEVRKIVLPEDDAWESVDDWLKKGQFVEVYTGDFVGGLKHGQGKAISADGTTYIGEWSHGMKSGHGVQTYPNGDVYEGSWKHDRRNGNGVMTYLSHVNSGGTLKELLAAEDQESATNADAANYVGTWKNDVRQGQGVLTFKNSDIYSGGWSHDLWDGPGKFTKGDTMELKFDGTFRHGRRHGKGETTDELGGKMICEYVHDCRHGAFTWILPTGEVRTGEFDTGRVHGKVAVNRKGLGPLEFEYKEGERIQPSVAINPKEAKKSPAEARTLPPDFPMPPDTLGHLPS
jgi:hypothetical protein